MVDQFIHRWLRIPYMLHVTIDRKVKKPRATVVFLHGIGHSGEVWHEIIAQLPSNVRCISIDLLGFGQSPKPHWPIYSVHLQARMFIATFLRLGIAGPVILVGHSLGGLVSVEIAKKYPRLVRSLVLCSPPFYREDVIAKKLLPHSDTILKDIYRAIHKHPEQFLKISALAVRYGLVNKGYSVTEDDVHAYMGALEASIINQTSLQDAIKIQKPIQIIHGALDAVVIGKNLKYLVKQNKNVTLTTILAGHEMVRLYVPAVVKSVATAIASQKPTSKRLEHAQD